jgi:hypothetical protein
MQDDQENSSSATPSWFSPRAWGPYLSKILGALVGLIYSPLTLPFIYAGNDTFVIHEANKEHWRNWIPKKNQDFHTGYLIAPWIVCGNTIGRFMWLVVKFPYNFCYSIYRGVVDGYQGGFLKAFINPSQSFNRYDTKGNLTTLFNQTDAKGHRINCYQFRSQHLLTLALFLTFFVSVIVAATLLFLPAILPVAFTPVAILAKTTGIKLATLLGINVTAYTIPLINFATTVLLTFSAVLALESAVSALIYLGKGINEFFNGIINPMTQSYKGNRITFALTRIVSLIDKCMAIVVGVPLYILYKPCFQLLDSVRKILRTNKVIWNEGKVNAEMRPVKGSRKTIESSFLYEYSYKAGLLFLLVGNTAGRIILLPFQIVFSLLYAPLQCVRHATKYGTPHMLAYPYRYANSYRNKLHVKGKENQEYKGEPENYNKIRVAEAANVYYFKKKHIAIVALLFGLAFVVLASFIPPLGYISISLSIKALTPLGLAQISMSGAAVLIVNFITGAVATTAAAVGLWASSWLLSKFSVAIVSFKRFVTKTKHFHNILHSSVSAGDALRILTRQILAVKTLNSVVNRQKTAEATAEENKEITDINHSWFFNLRQLLDPTGIWGKKKNHAKEKGVFDDPRPVYHAHDQDRKYHRHEDYQRINLRNNETETRKMSGERGRAKIGTWLISKLSLGFFPAYTKKTGVSLAPKDGIMAYFTRGDDDPIGLGFDITLLNTKGERYVFKNDAHTNNKWWWAWRYNDPAYNGVKQECVTLQQLRNVNEGLRQQGKVPDHNEILACLTAGALVAVIVSKDCLSYRINAIFRKMIIKQKLGVDLPILMMGTLNNYHGANDPHVPTREYTVEEQIYDLYVLSNKTDAEAENIFDAVAKKYIDKAHRKANSHVAKKDFVKTLINTHPVNWATLFNTRRNEPLNEKDFNTFIKHAAGIDLNRPVDYKLMETHLGTCVT